MYSGNLANGEIVWADQRHGLPAYSAPAAAENAAIAAACGEDRCGEEAVSAAVRPGDRMGAIDIAEQAGARRLRVSEQPFSVKKPRWAFSAIRSCGVVRRSAPRNHPKEFNMKKALLAIAATT
jgi:hypothetical protein